MKILEQMDYCGRGGGTVLVQHKLFKKKLFNYKPEQI